MLERYFSHLSGVMSEESHALADFYAHHGKLGENREAIVARFLERHLPRRFGVGSGFALFGSTVSSQQDVVIYDQLNNPVLFAEANAPLFPPSGLCAAMEIKSRLTKTELRQTVAKTHALKRDLRASFAFHPTPPRSEALVCLFTFESALDPAAVLQEMKRAEADLEADMRDRLDVVCLLGRGLVLGGSLMFATSNHGLPLLAESERPRQQRLAVAAENSLFLFYSRLLDYILARTEVRPQLMSYLPPDTPLGDVVAIG